MGRGHLGCLGPQGRKLGLCRRLIGHKSWYIHSLPWSSCLRLWRRLCRRTYYLLCHRRLRCCTCRCLLRGCLGLGDQRHRIRRRCAQLIMRALSRSRLRLHVPASRGHHKRYAIVERPREAAFTARPAI